MGSRLNKVAALFVAVVAVNGYAADTIVGVAKVIDGDTIEIDGNKVRFSGIDAPEKQQTCAFKGDEYNCGARARDYLITLIDKDKVSCEIKGRDKYMRLVGECSTIQNKSNLNALMVNSGNAVAYLQYGTAYLYDEIEARTHNRGVWATKFEMPWNYRHDLRGE